MPSWRENVSKETQADIDGAFSAVVQLTQLTMKKQRGFQPFAVALTTEGEQIIVMQDTAVAGTTKQDVLLSETQALLVARRDEIRAYALGFDVHVPSHNSDAIEVRVEHKDGTAMTIRVLYTTKRMKRGMELGEMLPSTGTRLVW